MSYGFSIKASSPLLPHTGKLPVKTDNAEAESVLLPRVLVHSRTFLNQTSVAVRQPGTIDRIVVFTRDPLTAML